LTPHIRVNGALGFEKVGEDSESKMRLTYVTPLFQLQAEGKGEDEFEASSQATEKMIAALAEMQTPEVGGIDELYEEDELGGPEEGSGNLH
jgi:hypothetical protein